MTFRTPQKLSLDLGEATDAFTTAGTVPETEETTGQRVRRSIGEWETGKPKTRTNATPPPQVKKIPRVAGPSKVTVEKRPSMERECLLLKTASKDVNRVAEARALVVKAKLALSQSRNLKTDIKNSLTEVLDGLFKIVKESETAKGKSEHFGEQDGEKNLFPSPSCTLKDKTDLPLKESFDLKDTMTEHTRLIQENMAQMKILTASLNRGTDDRVQASFVREDMDKLVGEVRDLRQASEETARRISSLQESVPSYADVLARPKSAASPTKFLSKHSIIVSSEDDMDTSDEVLGKVRDALDAKANGLQVTKVRKIKNQKVVLSCSSRDEMTKLATKIAEKNKKLKVEEATNKDPLIIIKNLLSFNKDDDIVSSLRSQNAGLLGDLSDDDFRAIVRYRRRARNPHENHVVLQVSPKLWQRLTLAKKMHIDLQYVTVQDQSPLVQCTRCLGYGHGRKLCKEPVDLCSYCAGPHLRADCPSYLTGETPTCRNCNLAKAPNTSHNAFDGECPVRKRWDAIARASVAYC